MQHTMSKILLCYGTRPELIKMAPLIWQMRSSEFRDQLIVVNTNQHKHTMFESEFDIEADVHLEAFAPNQNMSQLTAKMLSGMDALIQQLTGNGQEIQAIIAQGDTLTTLCTAQAAFFNRIPFYHIEAGLRSGMIHSPFPEEFNRKTVSSMSALHFAPSTVEKEHLVSEGVADGSVFVVGNTINDVLAHFYKDAHGEEKNAVLVSIHRKENQNDHLKMILDQVLELSQDHPELNFICLMHPAPIVREIFSHYDTLLDVRANLSYTEMMELYKCSKLIITDSGGMMEESAFLGIPRIIVRNDNERTGLLNLSDTFIHHPEKLNLRTQFEQALVMKGIRNYAYGTGAASQQIVDVLKTVLLPVLSSKEV